MVSGVTVHQLRRERVCLENFDQRNWFPSTILSCVDSYRRLLTPCKQRTLCLKVVWTYPEEFLRYVGHTRPIFSKVRRTDPAIRYVGRMRGIDLIYEDGAWCAPRAQDPEDHAYTNHRANLR